MNPPELIGIEVLPEPIEETSGRVEVFRLLVDIGDRKIPVIKAVRQYTNMGLKEAKEFVESAPVELTGLDPDILIQLVRELREAGATVQGTYTECC